MITKTKRDKAVVEHDGFLYRFAKREADGGKFCRCCGRIKTDANDIFVEYRNRQYNHVANLEQIKVRSICTKMRLEAETHQSTSLVDIYRRGLKRVGAETRPNP